ncbi:uncharacterized protein FIBRA_00033 [Fibroporia radiculosa]|uniref:Uncharacterized protein n=1 Tax=Fibroporia radiculosa TaxID=599839 RepID=J7S5I7_9APHY|nr:uncharacterized protein FIBRA_00033 [Fibroporia radiculosa]CCL98039.1 predicted protein [Fibroporia radiculosa]
MYNDKAQESDAAWRQRQPEPHGAPPPTYDDIYRSPSYAPPQNDAYGRPGPQDNMYGERGPQSDVYSQRGSPEDSPLIYVQRSSYANTNPYAGQDSRAAQPAPYGDHKVYNDPYARRDSPYEPPKQSYSEHAYGQYPGPSPNSRPEYPAQYPSGSHPGQYPPGQYDRDSYPSASSSRGSPYGTPGIADRSPSPYASSPGQPGPSGAGAAPAAPSGVLGVLKHMAPGESITKLLNPPPPPFLRHPPPNLPYSPFEPSTLMGTHKDLNKAFPLVAPPSRTVPHPFATHDITEQDWTRFLHDVHAAAGITPMNSLVANVAPAAMSLSLPMGFLVTRGIEKRMSRKKTGPTGELIDAWNHYFFGPRRMHITLAQGNMTFTGQDAGTQNSDPDSDSDSDSDSEDDHHGASNSASNNGSARSSRRADRRERRANRRAAKRERKEQKRERKSVSKENWRLIVSYK